MQQGFGKDLGPESGALWGCRDLLDAMPPFLTGGSMITRVTLQTAEWNEVPWKFEAGTPAIVEAMGLGAAVEYLESIGMATVRAHERGLFAEILDRHGVAVRAGHHCAQPVMQRFDLPATTRASFSVYNDLDDIDRLTDAIRAAQSIFGTA